jgi:subtilisin family serine protease
MLFRANRSKKIVRRKNFHRMLLVETLERRVVFAADFVPGELLVQFAPGWENTAPTLYGSQGNEVVESIRTVAMKRENAPGLDRVRLSPQQDVFAAAEYYKRQPGVLFAEPNWIVTKATGSNDTSYSSGQLWGMYSDDAGTPVGPSGTTNLFGSQAEKAWAAGATGSSSVVVGIVDEGIDINHPDLADNIWTNPYEVAGDGIDNDGNGYIDDMNGWDFVNRDKTVYDGASDDHGTHVAGTIGGVGGNGIGVAGVNWDVTMISTKFLGPTGGTTSNAVRALDYLTDLKTRHGINIVASNNSWGGGGYSTALHSAILRGANAGILFVASAGNNGANIESTPYYPASYSTLVGTTAQPASNYESVISVAALTSTGALASYSNFGATRVDIGAPGSAIVSTLPGGTYGSYSGTSMAAPHVTGALALYASQYPGAMAHSIRSAILNSAAPTASLAGKTATGDRLDIAAAMNTLPPPIDSYLSIAGTSVTEGNSGTKLLTYTVTINPAPTSDVTVNFATSGGTATSGSDYTAISGTLTFAAGQTTNTVTVVVFGDTLVESNETVLMVLSNPVGALILNGTGTGTITNDDAPPPPSIYISSVSNSESVSSFVFIVNLSFVTTSAVTVSFSTANGTATAGGNSDYMATSGTLTFNPGITTRSVTVTVNNDTTVEPNEVFYVNLSNPVGGTIASSRGTGTILDNDATGNSGSGSSDSTPAPLPPADSDSEFTSSDSDHGNGAVDHGFVAGHALKAGVSMAGKPAQTDLALGAGLPIDERDTTLDDLLRLDAISEDVFQRRTAKFGR